MFQKMVKNKSKKITENVQVFVPQNGPQNCQNPRRNRTGKSGQGFLEGNLSQEAARIAQDGPEEPKIAPSWPKKAPKIAPRWDKLGQDGPRLLQNCFKKALKSVKMDKAVSFALPLLFLCFSFAAEWGGFPKLYSLSGIYHDIPLMGRARRKARRTRGS